MGENDQELPQLHTAANPSRHEEEPQNKNSHTVPGKQLKKSNQLSRPHQDD